jgi:hypothetical protein
VVLDEAPNVGGQIWRHRSLATLGSEARTWIDRLSRTNADVRRGGRRGGRLGHGDAGDITVVAERHLGGVT